MWFAALRAEAYAAQGPGFAENWLTRDDSWLRQLLLRILQGKPLVRSLLGPDPFAGRPPRFVRLVLWQYRFSELGPDWWTRTEVGVVAGPVSLLNRDEP